jgi:DNA-binding GntR family transcriptional regulator
MDSLLLKELGRERAPEQVTNRLREAIVSGVLQPGDRLMQEELAERLGVSRMPIREALRRLEAEGLVVLQPYRGALVANLSSVELKEIYEIRIALETLALSFGVPEMDPESFNAMEVILRQMDVETDSATWLNLNSKFHTLLYKSAHRQLLHEHIESLRNKSDRFLRLFASRRDRTAQAQREHWAIVQACRERQIEQACGLLKEHLQSTVASLAGTLRIREEEKAQAPLRRKKE